MSLEFDVELKYSRTCHSAPSDLLRLKQDRFS